MSVNECRQLENLNPREGADELLVDKSLVPLRLALTASADDAADGSRGAVGSRFVRSRDGAALERAGGWDQADGALMAAERDRGRVWLDNGDQNND